MEWILIWGAIIAVVCILLAAVTSWVGFKLVKAMFKSFFKMFKEWD